MTYVIQQFEKNLKSFIEQCSFDKTHSHCSLIFDKKHTDSPFGDFSAFVSHKNCKKETDNETCVPNVFHEIQNLELSSKAENWSLVVDSIKVDCSRLILKLNREHANRSGLEFVARIRTEYGNNINFRNKVYIIKQDRLGEKVGLTDLRTKLTTQLIKALIMAGGGSVIEDEKNELEGIEILNIGKKCFGENAITVGAVKTINNNALLDDVFFSAEEYRKLRKNDINELSEHKENDIEVIIQLANAAVCFDMLSTKVDRPLILNVCSEPMTVREHSSKGATFVLYNYARICAILDQFYEKVMQKIYEPLPPISETCTGLLKQKEEWSLMFDYILEWPEVVCTCQNLTLLKLHNICSFLSSLSLCFSAFYRRCRVLTDPLPQLLPLMYARIHLLMAIKQVYQNAFQLLSIKAPTHM